MGYIALRMLLKRHVPRQILGFAKRLCTDADKSEKILVLCPGQGAQYTGMFAEPITNSNVEKLMQESIGILGYDICEIANDSPKDVLDRYVIVLNYFFNIYTESATKQIQNVAVNHLR